MEVVYFQPVMGADFSLLGEYGGSQEIDKEKYICFVCMFHFVCGLGFNSNTQGLIYYSLFFLIYFLLVFLYSLVFLTLSNTYRHTYIHIYIHTDRYNTYMYIYTYIHIHA